jgi:flagellin-like protein
MKIVQHGRKRKAISPVLATVILIAITLIAAIAVAGFVFGLFGSFTSSALVSVVNTSLVHGLLAAGPTGSVYASNTGTSNTNVNSMSLTWGGTTCQPGMTATTVTSGGGSVAIAITGVGTCGTMASASLAGESFTGQLFLSNGGQAAFSGTFS